MNYLILSFIKNNIKASELHLFEHCLSIKIDSLIKNKFKFYGILIEAETFVDSINIKLVCQNDNILLEILNKIQNISFDKSDIKMISQQKEIIKSEVQADYISDEDYSLYKSLNYLDYDLNNIYESNFTDSEKYIEIFNKIMSKMSYLYFQNNNIKIVKKDFSNGKNEHLSFVTDDYITGYISFEQADLKTIIEMSFLSFLLGKSEESILVENYLHPFNLYLGYTLNLSIDNMFVILLLCEKNSLNHNYFNEQKNIHADVTYEYIEKRKEAFKTFVKYTDPYLIEIFSIFLKTSSEADTELNDFSIIDTIDRIDSNKLKQILLEGI